MTSKAVRRTLSLAVLTLALALLLPAPDGWGAPVSQQEAVAAADLWIAMELNSGSAGGLAAKRSGKLGQLRKRQVLYLMGKGDLREQPPRKGAEVWAYVVKYRPGGFVVISGDDRIEPVLAFDVQSQFIWHEPGAECVKVLLGRILGNRRGHLQATLALQGAAAVHPLWQMLRAKLEQEPSLAPVAFDRAAKAILVELETASWSQGGYYNDPVEYHNGGHDVPTGCTATAMAILMRYFRWPLTGHDSHSYTDNEGDIQYSHEVNFAERSYDWAAMPTTSLTAANRDVADLMYHCGVAVEMDYELEGSGAWPSASAMNDYFRYSGTAENTSDHESALQYCIRACVPVIVSTETHTMLCDGYRDSPSPYYHINAGHNGSSDGWYSLTNLPAGEDQTIDRSYPYGVPSNCVYVDANWTGLQLGTLLLPFNNLSDGNAAVPARGHLWIKAGTYTGADNVPITFSTPMTIHSYRGAAVIR